MWNIYPRHEIEKRQPLPQKVLNTMDFADDVGPRKLYKSDIVVDYLRTKHRPVEIDTVIKENPEVLDPSYTKRFEHDEEPL